MSNKGKEYGLSTKEQQDLKAQASAHPFVNTQELTAYTIYSAAKNINNFDKLSPQIAVQRLKDEIKGQGFTGELKIKGASISDGPNTFTLKKTKTNGIEIGSETHDDTKRKK